VGHAGYAGNRLIEEMAVHYALDVAPLGDLADPSSLVRLARAAEAAGWDGFSTWDSLGVAMGTSAPDLFVVLAGVAAVTERISLLASVVVLPRRRPQLVAQSAGTLDRLSGGRLILGVGAGGDPPDFTKFGDTWDRPERIARMDEAVIVVDRLLRGETLVHQGPAYRVEGAAVGPRPVRQPRPPIWMGAFRAGGIRRAARWDGWIAVTVGEDGLSMAMPPAELAEWAATIRTERAAAGLAAEPFDIAVYGQDGLGGYTAADYEAAGATWWLESVSGLRGSVDDLLAISEAGPPR
jgi:alkanesulfonate monooxygenase SsuD/methylene tetrahydromethanopterin reductase-like flavin-dependent oxidoreductase (luciferase family)